MSNEFSSGLFGCFADFGVCIKGTICPGYLFATNKAKADGRECTICDCICCPREYYTRQQIRATYGFPQNNLTDCVVTGPCVACAACQDARELEIRENIEISTEIIDIIEKYKTKRNIKKQEINEIEKFISSISNTKQLLDKIFSSIEGIKEETKYLREQIYSQKTEIERVIESTLIYQKSLKNCELKKKAINQFIEHYYVSKETIRILKSPYPTPEFFKKLSIVQKKVENCKQILHEKRIPVLIEIIDELSIVLEESTDNLSRWVITQCKESEETSQLFKEGIKAISKNEEMYNHCIEVYKESKKQRILKSFISALTIGGPGGSPPPIDLNKGFKYISSMLAWIHQRIVSENETIISLIGKQLDEVFIPLIKAFKKRSKFTILNNISKLNELNLTYSTIEFYIERINEISPIYTFNDILSLCLDRIIKENESKWLKIRLPSEIINKNPPIILINEIKKSIEILNEQFSKPKNNNILLAMFNPIINSIKKFNDNEFILNSLEFLYSKLLNFPNFLLILSIEIEFFLNELASNYYNDLLINSNLLIPLSNLKNNIPLTNLIDLNKFYNFIDLGIPKFQLSENYLNLVNKLIINKILNDYELIYNSEFINKENLRTPLQIEGSLSVV